MFKQQLNEVLNGVDVAVTTEYAKAHVHLFIYNLSGGKTNLFDGINEEEYISGDVYFQYGVGYYAMSSLLSSLIKFRFDDVEQGVN